MVDIEETSESVLLWVTAFEQALCLDVPVVYVSEIAWETFDVFVSFFQGWSGLEREGLPCQSVTVGGVTFNRGWCLISQCVMGGLFTHS